MRLIFEVSKRDYDAFNAFCRGCDCDPDKGFSKLLEGMHIIAKLYDLAREHGGLTLGANGELIIDGKVVAQAVRAEGEMYPD